MSNSTLSGRFTDLRDFVKTNGFTEVVPAVRLNTNGYSFITFVNAKNEAENVYFGSSISDSFSEDQILTKEDFKGLQIFEYENAEGEPRRRLVQKGGNRISVDDLF